MNDYDSHNDYLLEQIKSASTPLDLFNRQNETFSCPKCSAHLNLERARYAENRFEKYLVIASCNACRAVLHLKLPDIKKKRVYLDQSILGELCKFADRSSSVKSRDWCERLLAKILLAKRLQKVCFVVSNAHVLETLPMADEAHKKALWSFSNDLADGHISGDMNEAFEYELFEILDGEIPKVPKLPLNCYMDYQIDTWSIRGPVQMTNTYLLHAYKGWSAFRDSSRQSFEETLKNQAKQIPLSSTVSECIAHVKGLYLADIFDGIKYAQNFADDILKRDTWLTELESNPTSFAPPTAIKNGPDRNGYAALIIQATLDHAQKGAQVGTLKNLYSKVQNLGINAFPSIKLQAIFEGEVLHRWMSGVQSNPRKFNVNYGMSKVMDIIHLAVFLPVVDIITVDKDTFNRCQQIEIKSEIEKYRCTMLRASESQSGLEHWLDDVLNEPEDEEVKATRRLFFGMDLNEEAKEMNDLLAELFDRCNLEKNLKAND
jgi:hypothetical protein